MGKREVEEPESKRWHHEKFLTGFGNGRGPGAKECRQRMWAASRMWKRKEKESSLRASRRNAALPTP